MHSIDMDSQMRVVPERTMIMYAICTDYQISVFDKRTVTVGSVLAI